MKKTEKLCMVIGILIGALIGYLLVIPIKEVPLQESWLIRIPIACLVGTEIGVIGMMVGSSIASSLGKDDIKTETVVEEFELVQVIPRNTYGEYSLDVEFIEKNEKRYAFIYLHKRYDDFPENGKIEEGKPLLIRTREIALNTSDWATRKLNDDFYTIFLPKDSIKPIVFFKKD